MYGYVYLTTNLVNGKKYIGKKTSPKFIPSYKGSGTLVMEAVKEYGSENFVTEILEIYESKEALEQGERDWIKAYNAMDSEDFYNLSCGGAGGGIAVTEDRLGKERYEEYLKNLSDGVARSYSTVEGLRELRSKQMKENRKHMHYTEESRRKTREGLKAWYNSLSPEEKKDLAERSHNTYRQHYSDHTVWDERPHPFIGRHHTEETKKKLSEYGKLLTGERNPNAKHGYITYHDEIVFTFTLKRDAYEYLKGLGMKKREYLSMAHGESYKGYQIHTESATTIESNSASRVSGSSSPVEAQSPQSGEKI